MLARLTHAGHDRLSGEGGALAPGAPRRLKLNAGLAERGAFLVKQRGEGICLSEGCGTRLARSSNLSPGRAARRDYCDACASTARLHGESDRKAIKFVLDSAGALVLRDAPNRHRARRLRRSQRATDTRS